jgi:DNA processing protein
MLKFSNELVIKTLQLPRIGRKTAFKLFEGQTKKIDDDYDFINFICSNVEAFKLPKFSDTDFENANRSFDRIVSSNEKLGIKTISYYDESYPTILKETIDKPIVLSYKGDISLINKMPTVAIIGTREPSELGASAGKRFGEIFGEKHFNVVSGLAIGCDASGHIGCLDKNGITTAVLAHGLDQVYPKENKLLAKRILDNNGLLISEYFVGYAPQANFFVERDRIQAGLSKGIIVVETDIKGGTMHTVRFGIDNGRKIAAFYMSNRNFLEHPKSQGNQKLINEGVATALTSPEDIEKFANQLHNQPKAEGNITTEDKEKKDDNFESGQLHLGLEF